MEPLDPKIRALLIALSSQRWLLRKCLERAQAALTACIPPTAAAIEQRFAAVGAAHELLIATNTLYLDAEVMAMFQADPELAKACNLAIPLPPEPERAAGLKIVPAAEAEALAKVLPIGGAAGEPAKGEGNKAGETK